MQPKKSLGQNFLTCSWVVDAIIKEAHLSKKDTILEIGPGTGVLTEALASHAQSVIAVEKDEHLAKKLSDTLVQKGMSNIKIIPGDILKNLEDVIETHLAKNPYKVVANIPYYLTSHLLRLLLEQKHKPTTIVLTIQKEVAERIISTPPNANLLGNSVQIFGTPKIISSVPPECFWPQPTVNSAIIAITNISDSFFTKNSIDEKSLFKIIKQGFSQKRKTLVNSLSNGEGDKDTIKQVLEKAHISLKARPEVLTLNDWVTLTSLLRK